MNDNWHKYFLEMTSLVASKSKDRSTKVGAVIVGMDNEVLSTGYNGFPRGVNDDLDERHERPLKYKITEHAERNAVYNAARAGIRLKDASIYLNYGPCPCTDCARAVIQSGVTMVVVPKDAPFPGKGDQWEEDLRIAKTMLLEAGVGILEWHPTDPVYHWPTD